MSKKVYIAFASLLVAVGAIVALNVTGTDSQAVTAPGTRRDCTAEDIIYCGALSQAELLQKYDQNDRDTKAIFSHFGIQRSDLAGTTSEVKMGKLKTNGDIYVGNQKVATNAQSTYRIKTKPQAQAFVVNGKTYYKLPVNGVYVWEADVFVLLKNGKFFSAVQSSCGNIIPGTPVEPPKPPEPPKPQPVFACESLKITKKISRVEYEFQATASASNATIKSYTFTFGDGNSKVVNTSAKTATASHTFADRKASYVVSVVVTMSDGKTTPVGNCRVNLTIEEKPEEPKPVFVCESLKISKVTDRIKFDFVATASAENTTIRSYTFDFGDGNSRTVMTSAKTASTSHTYADTPKSYTAKVTVATTDGKTSTNKNCEVPVTIKDKPVEKKPSIDIIKTVNGKEHIKVGVNTEFSYEITVRNTGNVTLKNAVVTDKAPSQITLVSAAEGKITGNEWKHTIPELKVGESKSFTIRAKYAQYAAGTHKNTVCVDTPTVPGNPDDCDDATTETKEPIKVCDLRDNTIKTIERSEFDESHMTTDLSKCGEIKVCIIEDKVIKVIAKNEYNESTMTTDLSKCEEIPVVPPELPRTGLETLLGGGLGVGSITAASYYWVASRRSLLDTLLNR